MNRITIWIDGDSLPRDIRALILRRHGKKTPSGQGVFEVRFVGTKILPDIPFDRWTGVDPGQDATDLYIEALAQPGDLVVTRDIPFAERILAKGVDCVNDRGERFDPKTIAERRSLRDAAAELRLLGLAPQPAKAGSRQETDKKRFADGLDKILSRR
jgi:hypothetical protein